MRVAQGAWTPVEDLVDGGREAEEVVGRRAGDAQVDGVGAAVGPAGEEDAAVALGGRRRQRLPHQQARGGVEDAHGRRRRAADGGQAAVAGRRQVHDAALVGRAQDLTPLQLACQAKRSVNPIESTRLPG